MIKVLLWDLDGTVLDFIAAEKEAIRKSFEKFGFGECTDAMIEQYSAINVKYWLALENNQMTKPEILVGRFREFFRERGLDESKAAAFNEEFQFWLGESSVFMPNAEETLRYFKGKRLQCMVSNGTEGVQKKKLSRTGLGEVFDHVFISEVVGVEKPNAGFFDRVFEVIGQYEKDEVMIIGDSLTSDIRGGSNAGILTCYYNPAHKVSDFQVHADYEIDDLARIIDIVEASR